MRIEMCKRQAILILYMFKRWIGEKLKKSIVFIEIIMFRLSIFFEALFKNELKIEHYKLDAILQICEAPNIEPVISIRCNVFFKSSVTGLFTIAKYKISRILT